MRFLRRSYALALAAALLAGMLSGCSRAAASGAAPAEKPGASRSASRRDAKIPVQTAVARSGVLKADRNAAGAVSPVTQSQVVAMVSGVVARVPRRVGDWVKAGEVVVQLNDDGLKIALANAEASLETAKINLNAVQDSTSQNNVKFSLQVRSAEAAKDSAQKYYDSQKALFDLGGISASQLDSAGSQLSAAEAALESAKVTLDQNQRGLATTPSQNVEALKVAVTTASNNLRQAQLNLNYAAIRAPFEGQIAALNVASGMYLGLNTVAFVLVSRARSVAFSVSPQDAQALALGTPLLFQCGGSTYKLKVSQTPSAPVNGVVPLAAEGAGLSGLPYGAVGDVEYVVSLARGALVPIEALETLESHNYVFVVEGGKAVARDVSVIAEAGATAAVSGLEDGSIVIVTPPPGLIAGAQVLPSAPKGEGAADASLPAQAGTPGGKGRGARGGKTSDASSPQTTVRP
jgi:multidrug efflux pump subunit AcrA (membrane-fusion protein)